MKSMKCPSCAFVDVTAGMKPFIRARDTNRTVSDHDFEYYRCDSCNYIMLSPIPEDLGRYYEEAYYSIPDGLDSLRRRGRALQQWKIDRVLTHKTGGRLLEIGPAYGLFACLAKDEGFDVSVIEMDSRSCAFLRDVVGVQVTQSADPAAALSQLGQFDVIVAWQVIEHLSDPWATLRAASEHLAPGGVLIMDTPNPDSFQFRMLGKHWAHLDAPRHVTLIPAAALTRNLKSIGLEPEVLTANDLSANGFNGFGWSHSFQNFFRGALPRRLADLFGRALGKILIPLERTGWRGSTYTAVFHKAGA